MFTQETDFTAGPDSHANDAHVGAPGRVRQVAVPPAARTLSMRSHSDYEDAFPTETDPAQDRTGGQWVRASLEDAPITMQRVLRWLLAAVGLQLSPFQSDGFVVGWEVRRGTPGVCAPWCQWSAHRPVGRPAPQAPAAHALWVTFVQQDNQMARGVGRSRASASAGGAIRPRTGQPQDS